MDNTNGLNKTLFGPLNKKYCYYYYALSLISLIGFVLYLFSVIFIGVSLKKGGMYYLTVFSISLLYAIGYLNGRLLFQMCSHSI